MRRIARVVVAAFLVAGGAHPARAQFSYTGTRYGATFVGFPVGVRNVGMGATGTADASHLSTGYFNPASVAFVDASNFIGSYEDMFADLSLSEFLVTTPVPFRDPGPREWRFSASLGYTRLWLQPQVERTIFLPEGTGKTYDQDDWMIAGAGAVSWSRGVVSLAGGGKAKLIQNAPDWPAMWSFDVGALAAFPIPVGGGSVRPRIGYAALNLDDGTSFRGYDYFVRTEQRGGFGFDLETPIVSMFGKAVPSGRFSFDYDLIDRQGDSVTKYGAGFELVLVDLVHVRYGLIDDNYRTYGVGTGWDYGRALFRLDYAHTSPQDDYETYRIDVDRDTFGAIVGVRW